MDELNESRQIGSTLPNFADVSSLLPGEYPGIMVETLLFWPPIPILVQMMKFSEQRKTIKSLTPLQVKISWLQHKQPVDYKPLHVGNVKLSSAKKCDVVESADPSYVEMHQNPKTSSGIRSSLHFFSSRHKY